MATDKEIREAGYKYIPLQKYLLNPFEIPTVEETDVVNEGIVNTDAFNNDKNFSVYNADPNKIANNTLQNSSLNIDKNILKTLLILDIFSIISLIFKCSKLQ